MRFWFVHSGEVSLREQIVAQVLLGIASGELAAGTRLPSTRALARRYGLHANTVSAAYGVLQEQGRVESRKGSGVFVRGGEAFAGEDAAGVLLARMIAQARSAGVPMESLRGRMRAWLETAERRGLVLLESDAALARIVLAELESGLGVPIHCVPFEDVSSIDVAMVTALVLPSKAERVRAALGPMAEMLVLQISPVPKALDHWLKKRAGDALVGIASGWEPFLQIAQTMLVAAGVPAECLVVRWSGAAGWERGLEATAAVVCDRVTAGLLPDGVQEIVYALVSEASLRELQERVLDGVSF